MDSTKLVEEMSIMDLFDKFVEASTMRNVLSIHHRILNYADLTPCEFNVFYPKLKRAVIVNKQRKNWKAKALFSKIDKRAAHRCYSNTKNLTPLGISNLNQDCVDESMTSQSSRTYMSNNALHSLNCLVIGSGPAGLRTAIELQLLGANRVTIVEKRGRFSRNNVLHLWPFVIDDLKSLGAKKFYGKFCAGSIDHISIRQLQLMLLKVCLMVGCDFRDSCSYISLCPASVKPCSAAVNGTSGDMKESKSSGDSSVNSATKCYLDEESNQSEFVKVSSELENSNDDEHQPIETNGDSSISSATDDGNLAIDDQARSQDQNASVKICTSTTDEYSRRPDDLRGAKAHFKCEFEPLEKELHSVEWDIIIGADGRRNTLSKFFPRKEFRGRLAIAITANFINRQTQAETSVPEISGLSFIYNQDMFNALAYETNIQLENICYYKDDTHYFVMTAKKKSLLERGVLLKDYPATQDLLADSNVDKEALLKYAKDAAYWTTGLEPLDFAVNHYGQEDCAMFDFTSMYAASNACKAIRTERGGLCLVSLVGDSLLEPFWPTGSGCARGFLSSLDAAWMCRQWAINRCPVIDYHNSNSSRLSQTRPSSTKNDVTDISTVPTTYNRMALSVMAERESIYRLLAQTTSENLQQNYSHWTLNPHTRYPNLNRHLVLPSQVEHLITDFEVKQHTLESIKLGVNTERGRRSKSPSFQNARKSPKKLKSANASPLAQPKNPRTRSRFLSKHTTKSRSQFDMTFDDTYNQLEESYRGLANLNGGRTTEYSHNRPPDCDTLDDLFLPSLSGAMPSSNNLSRLEAKRARDIDECLRQRRQKTKITIVRDQLLSQMRGEKALSQDRDILSSGNAALFNELRRMREQRNRVGVRHESAPRDASGGPLSLLNSMRRCASFAERVKSFESRLTSSSVDQSDQSTVTTPKTPIDDVKKLPQFMTLKELFVNNPTSLKVDEPKKKPPMPISKLTKDDWNVKCWEKKLAAHKQRMSNGDELVKSTRSLNKAYSVDLTQKPLKQVEVFQDRIKQMAEKLELPQENGCKVAQSEIDYDTRKTKETPKLVSRKIDCPSARSQGWINHLKRELVKGVESKQPNYNSGTQPKNAPVLNKPVKKLFEEDDDGDDGIDINGHYDHLCINRPTNKYLSKGVYTSHLARTKLDAKDYRIVDRFKLQAEGKQAYLNMLTSRGSSTSSTLSDYSSKIGVGFSLGDNVGAQKGAVDVECIRCKKFVSTQDRITVNNSTLHRICLTCANCGITMRSNEIQHYLKIIKSSKPGESSESGFVCAICAPEMRTQLSREDVEDASSFGGIYSDRDADHQFRNSTQRCIQSSRENFLSSRINYNELYKNILPTERNTTSQVPKVVKCAETDSQESNGETSSSGEEITHSRRLSGHRSDGDENLQKPVPQDGSSKSTSRYRIAKTETIDGSEQVTLILPEGISNRTTPCDESPKQQRELIDEDEVQRILHLNTSNDRLNCANADSTETDSDDNLAIESEDEHSDLEVQPVLRVGTSDVAVEQSEDESSSLNSASDAEAYDDDSDEEGYNLDLNSTNGDFVTSEEFDVSSDKENVAGVSRQGSEPNQITIELPAAANVRKRSDSSASKSLVDSRETAVK